MDQTHIVSETIGALRQKKSRCRAHSRTEILEITRKATEIGFGLTRRWFCSRRKDVSFRPTDFSGIGQDRASEKPSPKRMRPTLCLPSFIGGSCAQLDQYAPRHPR